MHIRKLLILSAGALFLASATVPSYAGKYLFGSDDEETAEAAKPENGKTNAKVDAKSKAKAEAAAKAKAKEEAKAAAKAKAEKEKLAKAKAKAEQDKKEAKAKAEKEKQIAKAKAAEEKKLAKARAEKEKQLARDNAAKAVRDAEIRQLASLEITKSGNNGELRSENAKPEKQDFFSTLFGGSKKTAMLPETRALDAVLEQKDAKRKFKVKDEFEPVVVEFSGYPKGTIVIDTAERRLYLMESSSRARRYAIAVGKDGLQYKGTVAVGDKQEWPRWIPTLDMQKREPKKYGQYKDGMAGGPNNPLGARAIYLYEGKKDTHLRIHGTNAPETIGTSSSNGCFRMINEHVMDLYGRVRMGTKVVVL
ncbi:MAG TPA: L,D-transpeptidase [Rhizobiaceae bacterium]|nr:L,D-transpeptidase [Rhizobiaceae bacterium]